MPNISEYNGQEPALDIAPVFAALGDERRLLLVSKLLDGNNQSLSKLTQDFALTRQGVSRHLRILEEAGLVRSHRIGRETKYRLEVEELNRAKDYLARASGQWDDAILRLAKHLES